jgi:outer membrane protein insertion porin family
MRYIFAALLLTLCAVFCFSQGTPADRPSDWYQDKPIRDIRFEGNKHIKPSELESTIESYRGKRFSDDLFRQLMDALNGLEYFEIVTPSAIPADPQGNEVIFVFKVVERPVISKITFVGNTFIKKPELSNVISTKANDIVNKVTISSDVMAIRGKYLEKGYPDITVRSDTRPSKNNTVEVIFIITEGERIVISAIFFEGNTIFSSSTLKGKLTMKAKGFGQKSGSYQDTKLIADRDAVTRYYHDKGYLDAEVTDVVQEITKDKKGNNNMVITYRLYEGRIYTFGGIEFQGNDIFTDEQLQALVRSKKGELANGSKIENDLQRVASLYYENGYIYNDIRRGEVRDTEEGTITYIITITEQGRAHIGSIVIRGNKKTKDSVILREIPLEPGDVYSSAKVMTGFRNLMNLQFFSSVYPEPVPGSEDGLMDLIINVEEGLTTDVQFGLTFAGSASPDEFPISALVSLTDRNFMGYGNQVRAEINASMITQSLSLEYSQRWLRDIPLSWGADITVSHSQRFTAMNNGITGPLFNGNEDYAYPDGFFSWEEYYSLNKLPPDEFLMEYQQWFLSLGLFSTYRWFTGVGTLGTGAGVRTGFINNSYDDNIRPFDPVIRERNGIWTPVNSIWTLLYLDKRDIYYDPSNGYYTSQRFSFYGFFPVELEHYIRSDTKAEIFFTLLDLPVTDNWNFKAVFGVHTGLSFIFPQINRDVPEIEDANRLYLDGMFVARGWYNERLRRGFALWENWAELRFPLVKNVLAFDLFFDAALASGMYSNTMVLPDEFFNNLDAEHWRFSMGGGFRFTIAQFPFRFLLAKRFKVVNGKVEMQPGNVFRQADKPDSGMDFVISFAIPTN